jgi:hypothetical protein
MRHLSYYCFLSFFRWQNLLSLDVVLIALAWQEVFARTAAVTLRWEERALLAISIWMVYITDHWLDAMMDLRSTAGFFSNKAPRHHYVRSHRWLLGTLLLIASLANGWLLWHLELRLLIAGVVLAVITLSYLMLNHFFLRQECWLKGREILISIIFSIGCALVALVESNRHWVLLLGVMAFSGVAFMNCTLIARMERNVFIFELAPRWTFSLRWVLVSCLWMVFLSFFSPAIVTALCWSLLGLVIVPIIARRFGYEVASLAADQVLFFAALFSLIR